MTDLSRLVEPRSVAVIGASATPGSPGHSATVNLIRHSQLSGAVHLVNPVRDAIEGISCLPSVEDLPQDEVDVAIVVVGASSVVETVEQCARRGVTHAIVPSGGLGETGEAGRAAEARLREIVASTGIRIYGPNCPGLTNVHDGIYLSVSPGASHDRTPGGIGLITQGGAVGRNVMQYGDRGVGIGYWFSAGNEVDLELCDFIDHLVEDDRTTTIACVIEGFQDGARFLRAAEEANARNKPVTALVLGRSTSGAQAAASHTAHLATADRVVRSLLRQHGVTVVDDIDELVEQAALFDRGVRPTRVAPCVISFSGGAAVAAADALELNGLVPVPLAATTVEVIRESLPAFGTVANPLDLTMEAMRRPEIVSSAVAALRSDPEVNVLVVAVPGDYGDITKSFVEETLAFEGSGRHVVPVWSSPRRGSGCTTLEAHGILPFTTSGGMARALFRAQAYSRWLDRHQPRSADALPGASGSDSTAHTAGPTESMAEFEAKQLLVRHGAVVPPGRLCSTVEDAETAAAELGWPLAMKVQSARILHKTEVGGVVLGVRSVEDLRLAWKEIEEAARAAGLKATDLDGILVEAMAERGTDLIVSVRKDPVFGRISAVGLGGVFTEVLGDIVFFAGRPTSAEVEAMLRTLSGWPILDGARGSRPVDITALTAVLDVLASAFDGENLLEIEINPLRAVDRSGDLIALDALILRPAPGTTGPADPGRDA